MVYNNNLALMKSHQKAGILRRGEVRQALLGDFYGIPWPEETTEQMQASQDTASSTVTDRKHYMIKQESNYLTETTIRPAMKPNTTEGH